MPKTSIINQIKQKIREIENFPKTGVNFKDITPVLADKKLFKLIINQLAKHCQKLRIDTVIGIDARGFLLAAPLAYKLGAGLVIVRKKGKLPPETISQEYQLEYGLDCLEITKDSIKSGGKALIVDDVLATGGTAKASWQLAKKAGLKVMEIIFLAELKFLKGRNKLKGKKIFSLIKY